MIIKCYACNQLVSSQDKVCKHCGAQQNNPKVVRIAGQVSTRTIAPKGTRRDGHRIGNGRKER